MQGLVVSGWCLVMIVPTLQRGNASPPAPCQPPGRRSAPRRRSHAGAWERSGTNGNPPAMPEAPFLGVLPPSQGRFANRTYGVCGVDAGLIVPTLLRRLLLLRKLPGRRFRRVDKRSAIHRLLFSAAGAGWIFQEDEWVDGATLIHPTSRILCVSAQAPVLPLASCVLRRGLFCGSGF